MNKGLAALLVLIAANLFLYQQFFLEQYMRYALRNEYIVLSLTTTPHRIYKIRETVETILKQNASIKNIYLSIPFEFNRDSISYTIPEWLLNNKRITILRTKDYGPATKLLGLLEQVKLPSNAIIVTADDDAFYPKNLVLQLAYRAMLNPNYAIGLSGANPNYAPDGTIAGNLKLGLIKHYHKQDFVTVLQGYAGIAYRAGFFDQSIFDIVNYPQDCVNSDDLYFAYYLAKKNVLRRNLLNKFISVYDVKWYNKISSGPDALVEQAITPVEKHRNCLAFMRSLEGNI